MLTFPQPLQGGVKRLTLANDDLDTHCTRLIG